MKGASTNIYLKPLEDHKCPYCGEKVSRKRRSAWQKVVFFALPLRHYTCDVCQKEIFAFSPSWRMMNSTEKVLRIMATVFVLLGGICIILWIVFIIASYVMI